MELTIIKQSREIKLYGVSMLHDQQKSYGEEIIHLLDQVWAEVNNKQLSHTGINYAVYEDNSILYAGVELSTPPATESSLEKKEINLQKYAYWKHIGPYSVLGDTHDRIRAKIQALGEHHISPLIEIYGHWTDDESKLETEIIYALG